MFRFSQIYKYLLLLLFAHYNHRRLLFNAHELHPNLKDEKKAYKNANCMKYNHYNDVQFMLVYLQNKSQNVSNIIKELFI